MQLLPGGVTVYAFKPRFQQFLRPVAARLFRIGVTANAVTVGAAAGSIVIALLIALSNSRRMFLLIPMWTFLRMALNAIDGMLARDFDQASVLGAYLNEIGDVVADTALYSPFAFITPFEPLGIALVLVLSAMAEFAGVLGSAVGASRRYDGPMGKSDRAVVFGMFGGWVGSSMPLPDWIAAAPAVLSLLLIATIVNRVRAGAAETARTTEGSR